MAEAADFESGEFDVAEFANELEGEPNRQVGTKMLLENDRVRIWEIRLAPDPNSLRPFALSASLRFSLQTHR